VKVRPLAILTVNGRNGCAVVRPRNCAVVAIASPFRFPSYHSR
jgi:hypothetical protein